jgi:glycosyltransferase involved in cell wall biosynthesis
MNKIIHFIILLIFNKLLYIKIPKISVIIPSYNINKYYYLQSSINSVLNQTLKNIELLIFDDNANDLTPIILDNYAKLNQRITIIHKTKNEMTGYARNTGLYFIMGEYISFLDYDDIFHKDVPKII